MDFAEAKAKSEQLWAEWKAAGAALQPFAPHRNAIGLLPDSIRLTPEYQEAKRASDAAFARLRHFNAWYVKAFPAKQRRKHA